MPGRSDTVGSEWLDQIRAANKRGQGAVAALVALTACIVLTILSSVSQRATASAEFTGLKQAKVNLDNVIAGIYALKIPEFHGDYEERLKTWKSALIALEQNGYFDSRPEPVKERLESLYAYLDDYQSTLYSLYRAQIPTDMNESSKTQARLMQKNGQSSKTPFEQLSPDLKSALIQILRFEDYAKSPSFRQALSEAQADAQLITESSEYPGEPKPSHAVKAYQARVEQLAKFQTFLNGYQFGLADETREEFNMSKGSDILSPILPDWLRYESITDQVSDAEKDYDASKKPTSLTVPLLNIPVTLNITGIGSIVACVAYLVYNAILVSRIRNLARNCFVSGDPPDLVHAAVADFPLVGDPKPSAYIVEPLMVSAPLIISTAYLAFLYWEQGPIRTDALSSRGDILGYIGACVLVFLFTLYVKSAAQSLAKDLAMPQCVLGGLCCGGKCRTAPFDYRTLFNTDQRTKFPDIEDLQAKAAVNLVTDSPVQTPSDHAPSG